MTIETDDATVPGTDTAAARRAERARVGVTLELLRQRVASDPAVEGVTFVDCLPRLYHPQLRIELDDPSSVSGQAGGAASPVVEYAGEVNVASVDGKIVGETGLSMQQAGLLAIHAMIMFVVCLLACVVPTRRALRVEPTEALRTD